MKRSMSGRRSVLSLGLVVVLAGGIAGDTANADILYVSDYANNTIDKVTSDGALSVFASTGLNHPRGVAFDSAGNLYVASSGNNTIEKFTPGGVGSVFASTGLNVPIDLAFDSAGNLYATNTGGNVNVGWIEKFTPGGIGSTFASGLDIPEGLAFDSSGNLYAAIGPLSTITKFTPGGVQSVFAQGGPGSGPLRGPFGLAFDPAGDLYVANYATIGKFTPGGAGSVFANSLGSELFGLAFDSAGNLYAADGTTGVQKFSPGGVGSFFTTTGSARQEGIAVTNDAGVPLQLPPPPALKPPSGPQPTQPAPITDPTPTKTNSLDTLILVTHGLNDNASSPSSWAQQMASSIANEVGVKTGAQVTFSNGYYKVGSTIVTAFDWGDVANQYPYIEEPIYGKADAENVGRNLGAQLVKDGYENIKSIHFIGHSAGAAVINEAARVVEQDAQGAGPTIQTTFLDPFAGIFLSGKEQYGAYSTWSDDYFAHDFTGASTQQLLTHAHNVDVTGLDPNAILGTSSHGFPITYYEQTIGSASGYGFPLSQEGGNWNPAAYPQGNNPAVILGSPPGLYSIGSYLRESTQVDYSKLTVSGGTLGLSATGSVGFSGTSVSLTTGSAAGSANKATHSASSADTTNVTDTAWVAGIVTASDSLNFVDFTADFTSAAGAQGLLSVYWEGNLIASIDERYALAGVQEYEFPLDNLYDTGSYTLSFRLDSFEQVPSSVSIDNIFTGYSSTSVPEPTGIISAFVVVAALYLRRTTRGSAS